MTLHRSQQRFGLHHEVSQQSLPSRKMRTEDLYKRKSKSKLNYSLT